MRGYLYKQMLVPAVLFCVAGKISGETHERPNVLFIMVDDLRPELGCYGVPVIKTPNIDRLAQSALLFRNAYCNVPVSGASRASLLTGVLPRYPDRFVNFDAWASRDCPSAVPVSKWFTDHGYYTISNGKVFHNIKDHDESWSEYPWRVNPEGYGADWAEYNKWELWMNKESGNFINRQSMRGPFCESADVSDTAYDDGKGALRTIEDLRRLKKEGKPFFLACGFWRPHLPFNAPKKYWDLYKPDEIPLATNQYLPSDLPEEVTPSKEIFSYARVTDTNEEAFQREAKHGYYACVSYIDAQVGMILDELAAQGLDKNTIVVFLGDHGWALGEHSFWGKHTLFDRATHVPLIIRVPGMKTGDTQSMASFVDIYPTLCELCGLPEPEGQLQGKSLAPVLVDPKATVQSEVYIQWTGGDNLVNNRYSYTEWVKKNNTDRMLFDHKKDKDENHNIAVQSRYTSLMKQFSVIIQKIKENL